MTRRWIVTAALVGAALIWAGTVAAAYEAIRRFETTPGQAARSSAVWPVASSIRPGPGEWALVMLVHPHCSCSRASVLELQAVIEKSPQSVKPYVLVYRPSDAEAGWEKTEVVAAAHRLRRAKVMLDEDGREAKLFGGFTSGQTFLYDRTGRLRFQGGITSLRGHAGLNRGRADIIRIAGAGRNDAKGTHPVFGCAISTSRPERTTP